MKTRRLFLLVGFVGLLAALPALKGGLLLNPFTFARQTEFYVDAVSGSDSNPGTATAPWQTLTKVSATSFAPDNQILLKAGENHYGTLALTSSGTNGHPITVGTYGTGKATISGGIPVTTWTQVDVPNNVWRATFAAATGRPRALYVDGIRVHRARTSGLPSGTTETATGYNTSASSDPGFMSTWGNQSDIELVYRRQNWTQARLPVVSIVANAITVQPDAFANLIVWSPNLTPPSGQFPAYVENAYEIFTANYERGTFYHDRTAGYLYMVPPLGVDDPNGAEVIAPVLEQIVTLTGVSDITFGQGVAFAHTTTLQPSTSEGFQEVQANTFNINGDPVVPATLFSRLPAAIELDTCTRVTFDHVLVEHTGSAGLRIHGPSADCIVRGSTVCDTGGNGLEIGNYDEYLPEDCPSGLNIHDNLVMRWGREFQGAVGIMQICADTSLIKHNEIHTGPYSALSCGLGWGEFIPNGNVNTEIEYNRVTAPMMVMGDGAAIYLNSQQLGGKAQYNDVSDIVAGPSVAGTEFSGLYLDNDSEGLTVENNLTRRVGYSIKLNQTHGNTIQDNTSDAGNYFTLGTNSNTVQEAVDEVGDVAADIAAATLSAGLTAPYESVRSLYYPIEYSLPRLFALADPDALGLSEDAAVAELIDKHNQVQWVQATSGNRPKTRLASFGGHDSLYFDGGDSLVSAAFPTTGVFTAWAVFQADHSDGTGVVFATGSGTSGVRLYLDGEVLRVVLGFSGNYSLGPISTQRELVVVRMGNARLSVWRNGVLVLDQVLQAMDAAADGMSLGASYEDTLHFTGKIADYGMAEVPLDYHLIEALIADLAPRYDVTWAPPVTTGLIADWDASTLTAGSLTTFPSTVNGYDAVADSGATTATVVANVLNGLPVVRCTAGQTRLTSPVIQGSVGTIIAVVGNISAYGVAPGWGGFQPSGKRVGTVYPDINTMFSGNSGEFFTTGYSIQVNGAATGTINHSGYQVVVLRKAPVAADAHYTIGDNLTNGTMTFDLAQERMYAENLSDSDLAPIVATLEAKWAITP